MREPETEIKHGGCYNCGNDKQPILRSILKPIINKKGDRDTSANGLALCVACALLDVIDMRMAVAAVRP